MKNNKKALRTIYKSLETIEKAETGREVDMITGAIIGVVVAEQKERKITRGMAKQLYNFALAVGAEKKIEIINETHWNRAR